MESGRMMQATYGGRTYSIPEMWVVGQTQLGRTILEAVVWWAYQAELQVFEEQESR